MEEMTKEMHDHIEMTRHQSCHSYKPRPYQSPEQKVEAEGELLAGIAKSVRNPIPTLSSRKTKFK